MRHTSQFRLPVTTLFCAGLFLSIAGIAAAQGRGRSAMMVEAGSSSYRMAALSIPFNFSRELNGRLELNLAGQAALAIEGGIQREGKDIDDEQTKETGEALQSRGYGGSLMISRYSDGMRMAGFYWTLGAGYREVEARWSVIAEGQDPQVDWSLVDYQDNKVGRLHHDAMLKGTTGTIRLGYRYMGEEIPLSIGAFIGARHFQAGVTDAQQKPGDPSRWGDESGVQYAPLTDREKERLRRRYTTKFEPGIEIGFAF